jgi:ABC-type antimicrobial peptide transport system permease subunit
MGQRPDPVIYRNVETATSAPFRIVSMVLRDAVGLVLTGSGIGLALAVPLAFGLRSVFVGPVSPLDPVVFVPIVALMVVVGFLAAALPARLAARVDPMQTLKEN